MQPFPATGAEYQITENGNFPRWSPDGRELLFSRGTQLFAVAVSTQPAFTLGNGAAVPGAMVFPSAFALTPARQFDIAPDGRIISVVDSAQASSGTSAAPRIEVVLNWFDELRRLVPTK